MPCYSKPGWLLIGWAVAVFFKFRGSEQEAEWVETQRGSWVPLGRRYPIGGWADGVWNESILRQVDGCHPHFAIASKQVASPSSFFTRRSPWRGTASPLSPIPSYTQCLYTHTCSHSQTQWRFFHDSQSLPAPGDWECKQSLSRLNPGVSFPFRPSSHMPPSPSVSAYNTDGIVINF